MSEIAPHEQEQFRAVADSASDAIISADSLGNIVYWNRAAESVFGYAVDEVLGRPLDFIMPERYRDAHHEGMARTNSGGESRVIGHTVELHGLRKDGAEFPLELSLSTWTIDGSVFYTGIIRDITERKQVERELHLMQTIALAVSTGDDLNDALYVGLKTVCDSTGWDYGEAWLPSETEDGTLLVRSPAYYVRDPAVQHFATMSARFSFRPGEGLPGRAWQTCNAEWVPDVTGANWHRLIARASLAQEVGLKAAVAIPVLDREEVVAVIVFYMRGAREQDTRLVKLVTAVAAELGLLIRRKQAEDEVRRLNEELESRVRERTAELESANQHLQAEIEERKRLEAQKDEFISVASHELRTPLTAIKGYTQLALKAAGARADEHLLSHLAIVDEKTDYLTRLVNAMLEVSGVESSSLQLKLTSFDLCQLVREVVGSRTRSAYDFEFEVELPARPVIVEADKERIEQVLITLVENAVRYSARLAGSERRVEVVVTAGAGEVATSVRDYGVGIPASQLGQVFNRFFRGANVKSARYPYPGLGLGLYVANGIVARHGGRMWVESTEGVGSTFSFALPLTGTAQ